MSHGAVYYSAPNVGLPNIKGSASANSGGSPAGSPRRSMEQSGLPSTPRSQQQQMSDRFDPKQSSRLVVQRLRHDRNKDISEVVQQGDYMHKGVASPTTARRQARTNNLDNMFDAKKDMRDDLLPDAEFVKRVFYTTANRQGGVIDATQFEESACVVFSRVKGLDVETIPAVAHQAHALMLQKMPREKKMTLENFHVSLVAAGYLLLMKPLLSIRRFATTKEFEFLAKNLGIDSPEDALRELDPNGTGRFELSDFVWWAANRTAVDREFTLDLLPMRALSVTSPRAPPPPGTEPRVSNAGRCAVSPRLKDLQKEGSPRFAPLDTTISSSSNNNNASPASVPRLNLPPMGAVEPEQKQPSRHGRHYPNEEKRNTSPRVVAFGGTTPRSESIVARVDGNGSRPSSVASSSSSARGAGSSPVVVTASPAPAPDAPVSKGPLVQQRTVGRGRNVNRRAYPAPATTAAEMLTRIQQEEQEQEQLRRQKAEEEEAEAQRQREAAAAAAAAQESERRRREAEIADAMLPAIRGSGSPRQHHNSNHRYQSNSPHNDSLASEYENEEFVSTQPQQQIGNIVSASSTPRGANLAAVARRYPGQQPRRGAGVLAGGVQRRYQHGANVVHAVRRNGGGGEDSNDISGDVEELLGDDGDDQAGSSANSGQVPDASVVTYHEFNYDHLPSVPAKQPPVPPPSSGRNARPVAVAVAVPTTPRRTTKSDPAPVPKVSTKGRYQTKGNLQEIL